MIFSFYFEGKAVNFNNNAVNFDFRTIISYYHLLQGIRKNPRTMFMLSIAVDTEKDNDAHQYQIKDVKSLLHLF